MLSICSTGYCISNDFIEEVPLRGGSIDSIVISIDELRLVNEKLIENEINLKKIEHYEFQVESYETLVTTLNSRIETMKSDMDKKDIQLNKEIKKKKLFFRTSVGATIVAIIFILI